MFKINLEANRIDPVEKRSFSELKLREREHLQEWVAHSPSALGEDLLVIQKEFSGFDGTQERLDLLALDAAGRLVIIENKLDDSGRDVTWQALKYAAYCSTLKTAQIIDIYHRHLGTGTREEATELLRDFLPDQGEEDLVLNPARSQRIFLVAANFRREITATALWLLDKGVSMSCFQVTPYQSGEDLFLDVSQIIPTPETGDYMIQLAEKAASDDLAAGAEVARHRRRRLFWEALFRRAGEIGIASFANRTPTKENWMVGSCGISGVQFSLVVTEKQARVQFEFVSAERELNKAWFDLTQEHSEAINAQFNEPVTWRRMDDAKSSRIVIATEVDFLDHDAWPDIIDWHLSRFKTLEKVVGPILPELSDLARGFSHV